MKFKVIITSLLITCLMFFSSPIIVEAKTTPSAINSSNYTVKDSETQEEISVIQSSVQSIAKDVENSSIVKAMAKLARWIISMFIRLIGVVFALVGVTDNTTLYFPQPTHIVFNLLPFFDPNFISPSDSNLQGKINLIQIISKAVKPMYVTSVTMVTSAFVIVALFIGIKLAISVSAQQKAVYKSAIMSWITGIAILYMGHFFMSGVFYINEQIVESLYKASQSDQLKVFIPMYDDADWSLYLKRVATGGIIGGLLLFSVGGWLVGGAIAGVTGSNNNLVKVQAAIEYGYEGIFDTFMQKAALGDVLSTALVGVLAGQTLSLVILYAKRLFFCVILGLVLPFVVLVDTIKKVVGGKGGLLEKWLMQFVSTVFMQSLHAFIMTFSLYFMFCLYDQGVGIYTGAELKKIYGKDDMYTIVNLNQLDDNENYLDAITSESPDGSSADSGGSNMASLIALVQFATIMSLTKVDDVIKNMFGIQGSMAGDMKSAGKDSLMGFAAVRQAGKSIGDNFSGVANSTRKIRNIRKQMNNLNQPSKPSNADSTSKVGPAGAPGAEGPLGGAAAGPLGGAAAGPLGAAAEGKGATGLVANLDPNNMNAQQQASVMNAASEGLTRATGYNNPALNNLQKSIDNLTRAMQNSNNQSKSEEASNKKEKDIDKSAKMDDLKSQLRDEQRTLFSKGAAAIATPSLIVAGTSIGMGAESKEIGASIIAAGDLIAEKIGSATKTGLNKVGAGDVSTKPLENTQILIEKITESSVAENVRDVRSRNVSNSKASSSDENKKTVDDM